MGPSAQPGIVGGIMADHRSNALLIAIEGIDGSGTTTQAKLLVDGLNAAAAGAAGAKAHLTNEPSPGPIGGLLRDILTGVIELHPTAVALLFAADRIDHWHREIAARIASGTHVVTDRYVYSSLAYQSVDHSLEWVDRINVHAPAADLTIYLRVDPDIAALRRVARGQHPELFDASDIQRAIARNYDALLGGSSESGTWQADAATGWSRRGEAIERGPWRTDVAILDGSQPPDVLHRQICELVQRLLQHRRIGE